MKQLLVDETRTDERAQAAPSRAREAWLRARNRGYEVVTNPSVRMVGLAVLVAATAAFAYAWVQTSRMIDRHLSGDVFEGRSGVFAAPLTVRVGQPATAADLTKYLQEVGYGSAQDGAAEGFLGRYALEGTTLSVEPQSPDVVDSGRFPAMKISFGPGGGGVRKIVDSRSNKEMKEAMLEPLMLASVGSSREKRIFVDYDAVPETLRQAIVTTEDRRFWEHHGVDYVGIARAVRKNVDEGGVVEGGSTLTQQLVKNVFLSPERTYTRKLKEAWVAWVLEWKLSKEQIFTLYSNEVYLGQTGTFAVHGFAEASRRYFGKDLSELTLDESAMLAGLIHAPNTNSPYKHPDRARQRRDVVLDMMVTTGAITPEQAEAAKKAEIKVVPPARDAAWLDAPYFNDYLQAYLEEANGGDAPNAGRYSVYTTLDIGLQRAATEVVNAQLAQLDKVVAGKAAPGTLQAALVAVEPKTGAVVAMVGGRNYEASQFNRASEALRQPGSVFKPLVYAAALSTGRFTASSPLMDRPQTFTFANGRKYEPGNFGEAYENREVPVRVAFKHSKNVPTVELALRTGLGTVASLAEKAGLPRPKEYPSMALGVAEATPLQIAEAYTAFANGGEAIEPTPVAATAGSGVDVPRPGRRTVISAQVAAVMTSLMEDVVNSGTGAAVRARGFRGAAAGKTGTSRDGWFAGYTPNLVCVVWVGFDDGSQLGITGADSALPIWTEFMKRAVAYRPELGGDAFARPSGLQQATVCDESGQLAAAGCPSTHQELFVAGTAPSSECYVHSGFYAQSPYVDDTIIEDYELPDDADGVVTDSEVTGGREVVQPGPPHPVYNPDKDADADAGATADDEVPDRRGRTGRDAAGAEPGKAYRPEGPPMLKPPRTPRRIDVPKTPQTERPAPPPPAGTDDGDN